MREENRNNVYDYIIEELLAKREPLTVVMDGVKMFTAMAGAASIWLWTMSVGDGDIEKADTLSKESTYGQAYSEDLSGVDFLIENMSGGQGRQGKDGTKESLDIEIIDEFPPESELELAVVEEQRRAPEEEEGVFVKMTNLVDTGSDSVYLCRDDGSVREEEGISIHLNTARFFVPDGGSRCFGVPNFYTELFGEGEREIRQELDNIDLIGDDCADFNEGIDVTRKLVDGGYLNDEIARVLGRFPQIEPFERKYTLRLVNAGTALRKEDRTSWWDVDYALYTEADNGEEIMLVYIDITRVTLVQGEVWDWDDAHYRIDAAVENLWRLMEEPVKDKGEVWIQQIRGDSFAKEAAVRRFVEEQGAALVVPRGADTAVDWDCRRQEEYYYDFLVWQGETADYEVTLAVPLMEKPDEGYYLASRIRKEAEDKSACCLVLSGMMQTFQGVPYLHVVKEGESLSKIAERYAGTQSLYPRMTLYDETSGETEAFDNPDVVYPGQKVTVPSMKEYDGRKCGAENLD